MVVYGQKSRLFVYDWQTAGAPESFAPLAAQPYSIFLDSARRSHPLARYSYICWAPFETIESRDGRVTVTNRDNQFTYNADPFQVVRERIALWGEAAKTRDDLPPFQGGACGFFGYGLAHGIEKLPQKNDSAQPDMCIGLYNKVIAFDHKTGKAWLIIHAADEAEALIHKSQIEQLVSSYKATAYHPKTAAWHTERNDRQFARDIGKVIEYIHAGDIFQANLSRRFTADMPDGFDPYAHYLHLRDINAAPYAAYMNFGGVTLASCSPERFLELNGRQVETRPIKGTLPSSLPSSVLMSSDKDYAENIMIVDLLRNDLSKVCEDHSVQVQKLCDIETFEGLHHMVSTVSATLRADKGPLDLLKACFPGGSITGAPKVRAMQIIAELEPHSRGAYCGALGYVGFDGAMDTAITIRTLVYENGQIRLQTGGGIVSGSDPLREVQETLTKAHKIFESFESVQSAKRRA